MGTKIGQLTLAYFIQLYLILLKIKYIWCSNNLFTIYFKLKVLYKKSLAKLNFRLCYRPCFVSGPFLLSVNVFGGANNHLKATNSDMTVFY